MSNINPTINTTATINTPILISSPPPNIPLADGGGTGFWRLPFIISANADTYSATIFTINAIGSLPLGSELQLRLPDSLKQALNVQLVTGLPFEGTTGVPLPPTETRVIGEGVLEPGSKTECEMQIKVQGETYWKPGVWEFTISQFREGSEVGSVVWRFGQP